MTGCGRTCIKSPFLNMYVEQGEILALTEFARREDATWHNQILVLGNVSPGQSSPIFHHVASEVAGSLGYDPVNTRNVDQNVSYGLMDSFGRDYCKWNPQIAATSHICILENEG